MTVPEGGGGAQFEPDEIPGSGGSGDSFRPTVAAILDCGWLPQNPPGSWDNNACGPVSLEMGAACIQGRSAPTASDTLALLRWMNSNITQYNYNENTGSGSYTSLNQLITVASNYFQAPSRRVTGFTLAQLYDEFSAGRPVVVGVKTQSCGVGASTVYNDYPSDAMWSCGSGHFMLAVGMTQTHIILNDPGRGAASNGDHRAYTIASFASVWTHSGLTFSPVPVPCPGDCNGHGACNPVNGVCACSLGFQGVACDSCAPGYASYPVCHAVASCPSDCNGHGTCDSQTGVCACAPAYEGPSCGVCSPGHFGYPDCCASLQTYFRDGDGDGYGNSSVTTSACTAPPGFVQNANDCDDSHVAIHPGAAEVPDYLDNDCNGNVDELSRTVMRRRFGGNGLASSNPAANFDHCFSGGSANSCATGESSSLGSYSYDGVSFKLYDLSIGSATTQAVGPVTLVRLAECYNGAASEHRYWTMDSLQYSILSSTAGWVCTPVGYVKTGASSGLDPTREISMHWHIGQQMLSDSMYSTIALEGAPDYAPQGVVWFAWQ